MAQAAEAKRRGKAREKSVDQQALLKAYRTMLLIRRFEEKAGQLYGMGLIGGFCHLYIGQEAVVVGVQLALSDGDEVITSYRDHGHMLATTGMEPRGVMAELTRAVEVGILAWQGRVYAHVQQGEEILRRARHRRCAGQPGHRPRIQQPVSWQRSGLDHILWRGRLEPRAGVRELQPCGADEVAGGLCDREQQVRYGHLGRAGLG